MDLPNGRKSLLFAQVAIKKLAEMLVGQGVDIFIPEKERKYRYIGMLRWESPRLRKDTKKCGKTEFFHSLMEQGSK